MRKMGKKITYGGHEKEDLQAGWGNLRLALSPGVEGASWRLKATVNGYVDT
jgi:hypothetical protein